MSLFDETIRIQHARTKERRWVRLRSAPRRGSDGLVVWDGIYADVSDQKNIAQALTHSLERLDLARRAGHIGVFDMAARSRRKVRAKRWARSSSCVCLLQKARRRC